MNYGFLINNRTCIGCHACSTACKSENEVPLGVSRTWVKYVETGTFPDSRRHFQVTRCNHCQNPPCVRICPVTAMYQRTDGIVEFDGDECIGCKACLQACPYDAIHIDPATGTAAKCHMCSHRVDIGLEPACVVVCPEHSILFGDMDDSTTEIARALAKEKVSVRKPEQGTVPNLFYIEGHDVSLHPTATELPSTYMFADVVSEQRPASTESEHASHKTARSGAAIRQPGEQGRGPVTIGGTRAEHMVQVGYNAQHKIPWHWPVPAYLVTKGIAAGAFLLLAFAWWFDVVDATPQLFFATSALGLFAVVLTTALLVLDLEHPMRFLRIITRPQWQSWLTRGAFVLIAFSLVLTALVALEGGALFGLLDPSLAAGARPILMALGVPLAVLTAIYTAFLFGQAEGRDLWQSPLLPFHLLVQAVLVGAASLMLLGAFVTLPPELASASIATFVICIAVDLFVTLLGEFGMPHASELAVRAAHDIRRGTYRYHFWLGSMVIGHLLPLVILQSGLGGGEAIAAVYAIIGLYFFEYAFIMAPQKIANS